MPSYQHELLVLLFRNRSASAADLLRELNVQIPAYDEVRTESSDINDLKPAEYRADLVLFLVRKAQKVLGVIVEVQLGRDEDKAYAWPAYVANLRARHRCPVCLLVVTIDEAVSRWAGKSIELGPGARYTPWVIGPTNMPAMTELQQAADNVELAVLSAIEHGQGSDRELAERIAAAALTATSGIDAERSRLYLDLLSISVLQKDMDGTSDIMLNSLGFEYQSAFARRYVAEGLEEGRKEGRVDLILKQLTRRFGALSEPVQTLVRGARDAQLDKVAEDLLSAQTLEQALGSLS